MNSENRYYRITGGILLEKHNEFLKKREEQRVARQAFQRKFGASEMYSTPTCVVSICFPDNKAPEGWRPYKQTPEGFVPPKGKAGEAIRSEMRSLRVIDGSDYNHTMIGNGGFFVGAGPGTSFRIRYAGFEIINGQVILIIPNCKDADKWTPPDDGCTELKASEFWRLKEEAEAKAEGQSNG